MRRLGRYALLTRLAQSDSGEVYLARLREPLPEQVFDMSVGAALVVKLIAPELVLNEAFAGALLSEGEKATAFRHPSVVPLLETDRRAPDVFVARPLVRGLSLAELLAREHHTPLSVHTALWVAAEAASALAAAHESTIQEGGFGFGVITPRSVLLDYDGKVSLLGLGEGRARAQVDVPAWQPYCAPELRAPGPAQGRPDARSDLYSLGIVMLELLSGRRSRGAPEPGQVGVELARFDADLVALVESLLSPLASDRPDSARLVEQFLRAMIGASSAEMRGQLRGMLGDRFAAERAAFERVVGAAIDRHDAVGTGSKGLPSVEPAPMAAVRFPELSSSMVAEESTAVDEEFHAVTESEAPLDALEMSSSEHLTHPGFESEAAFDTRTERAESDVPPLPRPSSARALSGGGRSESGRPERIGRYEIDDPISVSAKSVVYLGFDPVLSRRVAVKMGVDGATDVDSALFERELRIAARAQRIPGVPTLLDAGHLAGRSYGVFQYIEGESLEHLLARNAGLSTADIRALIAQLAETLQAFENSGIVHGALLAENILMREDRAWLVDFSGASAPPEPELARPEGRVPGVGPEVLTGGGMTARSDQFALGALLYRILTRGASLAGAGARAVLESIPPPPGSVAEDVDEKLAEISMRMLEKEPLLRYESYDEILRALEGRDRTTSVLPSIDPMSSRFQGADDAELWLSLTELVERTAGMIEPFELMTWRRPVEVGRSLARRLGLEDARERRIAMALAFQGMFDRLGLGLASELTSGVIPTAIAELLEASERVIDGQSKDAPSIDAQITATVLYYFELTTSGEHMLTPERALSVLRTFVHRDRVRGSVLEAFGAHLEEMGAASFADAEFTANTDRRVLVATMDDRSQICDELEALGFEVGKVRDSKEAWTALEATTYQGVVVAPELVELEGAALFGLVRGDRRTRHLPMVLLGGQAAKAPSFEDSVTQVLPTDADGSALVEVLTELGAG